MIPLKPTNTPINVYLIDFNVQERINASINDSKNINHLKMIKAKPYEDPKYHYTHQKCINLINKGLQFLFVQLLPNPRQIYS